VYTWDVVNKYWFQSNTLYYPNPPSVNVRQSYEICLDELHRGPPYKTGGPLHLRRYKTEFTPSNTCECSAGNTRYSGTFVSIPNQQLILDAFNSYATPTAGSWGATAWAKFRPAKPIASGGQFLRELEDFPSMFKARLREFKDLGNNYLNYQFGWVPFINDVKKFIQLQDTIEDRLARIRKDNGKWKKRKGTIRNQSTETSSTVANRVAPVLSTYVYYPPHFATDPAQVTIKTVDKIWFEACWRYWIDDLNVDSSRSIWTSNIRQRLWGLRITPSLLWAITPWSWLVDWTVNVRDIVDNISDAAYDNLVAKYAYVMRYRRYEEQVLWTDSLHAYPSGYVYPRCITTSWAECKERQTASQMGFGQLGEGDLSPRQLAILAALGLTRLL